MTTPWMSESLVTVTVTFLDDTGTPADPSVITLKYKAGTADTITAVYPASPVTKVSAGIYQAELDTTGFTGPGQQPWTVQWSGTGNVQAIAVATFTVVPAAL